MNIAGRYGPELRVKLRCVLSVLMVLSAGEMFSQTDYDFWFAAPEISYAITAPPAFDTTGIDRPVVLVLSTCEGPAIVTISQPANPGFQVITDTLQTGSFHQVDLTARIDQVECKPANTILSTGLLISSTKPVNAVYEIQNRINSEGYTLKGINALGNEFLVPAQNQYQNYPYCDPPARNSFALVASEDMTTVKVIPSQLMEGQPGTDTITILLNRGQTWCGRALSGDSAMHLGGTFILADKPIAVTVTDDALRPPAATGLSVDIAGDQLIPRHLMSDEYLAFPVDYWSGFLSVLYIYAFEDGTSVTVDGSGIGTINRGGLLKHTIGVTAYSPAYIQSSKPVEVYAFYKDHLGSSEVAGEVISPLTCAGSFQVTFARTGPYGVGDDYWIRILSKTADCGNFTCSNSSVQGYMVPANFITLPATGNLWGYYAIGSAGLGQITFGNSTGNFQVSTINELAMGALRANIYTSFSGLNLGPDRTLCPGDTLLLDAGYGNYQYLWSTGATSRTLRVASAGTYWVRKSSASCVLSDTLVVNALNYTPVNLGGEASVCQGDSLLLDAGPGKSWYLWSTGQTTQSIFVHDSGSYRVTVPVSPCNFNDSATVHVAIAGATGLGPGRAICAGDSVLLDAGPGMTSYLWNTGATTQSIEAAASGIYSVILHKKNCIFYDSVNVLVNPVPVVNLGPDDTICAGETRTFDAGFCAGCAYAWDDLTTGQMNAGTGQTFTTGQSGTYVVHVTASGGCTGNDTIRLLSIQGSPVTLVIQPSGNPVCQGSWVTFLAMPGNGGLTPAFQWKVNGVNIPGGNSGVFSYSPVDGDIVTCTLISSGTCVSGNPATSNPVIMVVNPSALAGITVAVSANPFCSGSQVTFTATPEGGGSSPSFQWLVNDIPVATGNAGVFTFQPVNLDSVRCVMTSSLGCVTGSPVSSSTIVMTGRPPPLVSFAACFDTVTTTGAKPFHLKGGLPPGGTYSGPGVNQATGIFTPSSAGPGNHLVHYSCTNSLGCSSSAIAHIHNFQAAAFNCGSPFTDIRDNRVYPTVPLGIQCWMAADLNYGSSINYRVPQSDNCMAEKYSLQPVSGSHPSALYQWDELMQYSTDEAVQGLCPPGWHIPAAAEWDTLATYFAGPGRAGAPLKDTLAAGGFRSIQQGMLYLNNTWAFASGTDAAAMYWTSTASGNLRSTARGMNEVNYSVSLYAALRANAFSVRCVRN
ncbi:MAG: FISUMP domain-containing protein [Bacteroidota bacterium]